MIGLFCGTKANSNEEFKKVIKDRMNKMIITFAVGVITLVVALLAEYVWDTPISEHMLGAYSGAGTGLILASILFWIKNKRMLSDDERIKKSRLNHTDERIQEISTKAFKAASVSLLIGIYMLALIGGLFYPILVTATLPLIFVFIAGYIISFFIYEKRM
jgi:hypothetical protein